jgi:DNA-binding MarR family transcriptional regulator
MANRSGPHLALMLLGGFRSLVEAGQAELAARGYPDVRPVHEFAIRAIGEGADSASELGRRLGVSKQAAAKTIAVLEERGYVAREADPADGRRRRLTVTGEGEALLRAGAEIFDRLREGWAEQIGSDRLEAVESALEDLGVESRSRFDAPGWLAGSST